MTRQDDIRAGGTGGDENRRPPGAGPSRRRYHRDALGAVLAMLGTISPEAASLFAAIVAIRGDRRGPDERALDRTELATMLKLEGDGALDRYLVDVGDQITDATGLKCLDTTCRAELVAKAHDAHDTERRPTARDLIKAATAADADDQASGPAPVLLGKAFAEMLDAPHPPAVKSIPLPRLDRPGQADIAMVEAIVTAGVGGHLTVRRASHAPRETSDLAAILGADGREVLVYDGPDSLCFAAILRTELHAGERTPLMIVDRDLLIADAAPAEDGWDEPVARGPDDPAISSFARDLPSRLAGARGLYLWSVPEGRSIPCASLPWIGACIGPICFDPAWARGNRRRSSRPRRRRHGVAGRRRPRTPFAGPARCRCHGDNGTGDRRREGRGSGSGLRAGREELRRRSLGDERPEPALRRPSSRLWRGGPPTPRPRPRGGAQRRASSRLWSAWGRQVRLRPRIGPSHGGQRSRALRRTGRFPGKGVGGRPKGSSATSGGARQTTAPSSSSTSSMPSAAGARLAT